VFRPQTGYYEDSIAEAAALFESLIQNHPFIDGNKRTALGAPRAALADVHVDTASHQTQGDVTRRHSKRFNAGAGLGPDARTVLERKPTARGTNGCIARKIEFDEGLTALEQ
jgi:hypothetical protein